MIKYVSTYSKFLLVLCLFLLIGSGRIESSDGISALSVTKNIVQEHNLSMSRPEFSRGLQTVQGSDGRYYSPTSLGASLLYLPSALVTNAVYQVNGGRFAPFYPLQTDYLLEFFASFTAPLLAFLLFIVDYKIFNLFTKNKNTAFFLSLVISFSTNLLPLSKDAFSHIPFALFTILSFYFLLLFHLKSKSVKNLIFSGAFCGLACVSYNVVFILIYGFLIGMLFYFSILEKVNVRVIVKNIGIWILSSLPFLIMILWFNFIRFGSILKTGYDPQSLELTTKGVFFEGMWGLLLSPGKSMLLYSPVLILSIVIAIRNFRKEWSSQLFITLTIVLILFYSQFIFWSGELSWGPRYMSLLLPFAGTVFARNYKEVKKHFRLFVFLIIVGLFIQLEGVVIPYERQYLITDFPILSLSQNIKRNEQYAYWSLGEFIPRYSPIYRFKKEIFKQIVLIPALLRPKQDILFAKNASLPMKDPQGGYYKKIKSNFSMYTRKPIKLSRLALISTSLPPDIIAKICALNCSDGKVTAEQGKVIISLSETTEIPKNSYFSVDLKKQIDKKSQFEFNLNSLEINDEKISMKDYSLVRLDSFLLKDTLLSFQPENRKQLEENLFYRDEVSNQTPDFWWAKSSIYFNEPSYTRAFFVILLFLTLGSIVITVVNSKNE